MAFKRFIPGIIWLVIILILLLMPAGDFPSTNNWLPGDKFIHGGIFAVLTFLFLLPAPFISKSKLKREIYKLTVVLLSVGFGILTEVLQEKLTTDRTFDLKDWAADSAGIIIAYIAYQIFESRRKTL